MAVPVGPVPATSDEVTCGETARSFEAFYESTHARLYTALCLVTGSRHEAEEVMRRLSSACGSGGTGSVAWRRPLGTSTVQR